MTQQARTTYSMPSNVVPPRHLQNGGVPYRPGNGAAAPYPEQRDGDAAGRAHGDRHRSTNGAGERHQAAMRVSVAYTPLDARSVPYAPTGDHDPGTSRRGCD